MQYRGNPGTAPPPLPQKPGFLRSCWDFLTKPGWAKAGLTLLGIVGLGYASQSLEGTVAMLSQGAASFLALMLCIQLTRFFCCCWGSDTKQNAANSSNTHVPTPFEQGYQEGLQAGHDAASQPQFRTSQSGVFNRAPNSTDPFERGYDQGFRAGLSAARAAFNSTYSRQPGMPGVVIHNNNNAPTIPMNSNNTMGTGVPGPYYPPQRSPTAPLPALTYGELEPGGTQTSEGYQPTR